MLDMVFKHRSTVMGIACMWIVWYHLAINHGGFVFNQLKSNGALGVDIFVFISGVSMWSSLNRNMDWKRFFRRRVQRVLVPYYMFLPLLYVVMWFVSKDVEISRIIKGLLVCDVNWFCLFIVIVYALTPLIYYLVNKQKLISIVVIIALLVISIVFHQQYGIIKFVERIVDYFIGMLVASKEKNSDRNIAVYAIVTASIGVLLWISMMIMLHLDNYNPYFSSQSIVRLTYILIAPGLTYMIAYFFEKIKCLRLEKVICYVGNSSFEVLLWQALLVEYLYNVHMNSDVIVVAYLVMLSSFVFGIIWHAMVQQLNSRKIDKYCI